MPTHQTPDPKWDAIVNTLCEGLNHSQTKQFKMLAENTKNLYMDDVRRRRFNSDATLLTENASAGAISAANIGTLVKVILPVLRRVLPTTISQDIIGNVPMDGPVGQIVSIRPTYGTTSAGAGTIAGQEMLAPLHVRSLAAAYSGNEVSSLPAGAPVSKLEGVLGNTVTVDTVKQTVEAKTRRLQTRITPEAMMDAQSQYNIDLSTSALEYMASDLITEIDQEVLRTLRQLAPTPTAANTYDQAAVSGGGGAASVADEHAALAILIQRAAMKVAAKTRRSAANWTVLNPALVSVLESARASTLVRSTSSGDKGFNAPTTGNFIGTLNGTMQVFADVYASDATSALVGLKVSDQDAAAILATYVPISTIGDGMIDPNTGESIYAMTTRYSLVTFTDTNTSLGNSADYLEAIGVNAANLAFL